MSTFVMVLVAGMVVGSGPEVVSDEAEERFHFDYEYKGILKSMDGRLVPTSFIYLGDHSFGLIYGAHRRDFKAFILGQIVDQGEGRFKAILQKQIRLGIYKQDGENLTICYARPGAPRPKIFRGGEGQDLLILHRDKPH